MVFVLADDLRSRVHEFFVEHSHRFGLDPATLGVTYVLNWGGFVNYSFRVRDARTQLHLKLGVTESARGALKRWQELDHLLQRYHAPLVLDHVELGDAYGLLFPAVEGSTPGLANDVMAAVLDRLRALWVDDELAACLSSGSVRTAAGCYLDTYHDRCPIHGDLWLNNVLWKDVGSWHILDWDDLQIGDPAMDLAMLTGPTAVDVAPLKGVDQLRDTMPADVMERLGTLGRAALLDWVIDPLADWLEAGIAPDAEAVRREKQRVHARALKLYRKLYSDA